MNRMNLFGESTVSNSNSWNDFKFTLLEVTSKGIYLDKIVKVNVNNLEFIIGVYPSRCYEHVKVDLVDLPEVCIDEILKNLEGSGIKFPDEKLNTAFSGMLLKRGEFIGSRFIRDKRFIQNEYIEEDIDIPFLDSIMKALVKQEELMSTDTPEVGKLVVKFKTKYSEGEILEGKVSSVHKELYAIDYFNRNQYVTVANLEDGKVYDVLDYDEVNLDNYDLINTVFYPYFGIHGNTEFYDLLINKPGKYRFEDDCVNSSFDKEIRNLYSEDEVVDVANKAIEAFKRRSKRFRHCPDNDVEEFTKYYKEALKRIYG